MSLLRSHFEELPAMLNDTGYLARLYNGCLPPNPPSILSENKRTAWKNLRMLIEMLDNKVVNNSRVRDVNLKVNRFFCLYEHLRTQVREHDWSEYPLSIPAPLEQAASTYQSSISPSLVVAQTQKLWMLYTQISRVLKTQSMIQDSESGRSSADDELGPRGGRGDRPRAPSSQQPAFGGVSGLIPGGSGPTRGLPPRSTSVPRMSPAGMMAMCVSRDGLQSGPCVVQR